MKRTIRVGVPLVMLLSAALGCAQTGCFSNAAQAVAGKGQPDADGFRLEGTMRDRLNGGLWAQVGRCGHPDWPALLVKAPVFASAGVAEGRLPHTDRSEQIARGSAGNASARVVFAAEEPAVRAGETVTIAEHSALVRLEIAGVALSRGYVGDQVQCRVGNQQFVVGTVKQRGVVEIQ